MLSHVLTVLVIEDDSEIALLIVEILEAAGFRSAHAGTGREGLRLAQALKPDLVVCDACLPGMNGPEIIRELKSDAETAPIPVILMSGYGEGPFQHVAAYRFVAKPFQLREMMEAVRSVLRDRESAALVNA